MQNFCHNTEKYLIYTGGNLLLRLWGIAFPSNCDNLNNFTSAWVKEIIIPGTFCNALPCMMWKTHFLGVLFGYVDNVLYLYFVMLLFVMTMFGYNATKESQEYFLRLHLLVRLQAAQLSFFDRKQNSVARWLRLSNFENTRLMHCLGHIIVSTCPKWINDSEKMCRSHRFACPCVIK